MDAPDKLAQLQALRERQNRWMRERQSEMDRQSVLLEIQADAASAAALLPPADSSGLPGGRGSDNGGASTSGRGGMTALAPLGRGGPAGGAGMAVVGGRGGVGATAAAAAAAGAAVSGVRPEEVIDRLTERITDRLRSELRVELQKESSTLQQRSAVQEQQLEAYLSKELETQNTCPVCYDLMVPPEHAPMILFPCGHTFCNACIVSHVDKHRRVHCPVCRKKIDSRAPNFSLQQLIQNFVSKKQAAERGLPVGGGASVSGGGDGGGFGGAAVSASSACGDDDPASGGTAGSGSGATADYDRVRRQHDQVSMRLRVLRNELVDTHSEEAAADAKLGGAEAVMRLMRQQEADALRRLEALQAELDLIHQQMTAQESKTRGLEDEKEQLRQRRQLLVATIGPLEGEAEKLSLLMEGLQEAAAAAGPGRR